jgi:hypothetical protein
MNNSIGLKFALCVMRIKWKRFLANRRLVPSFCKMCGRDVHDYIAPDDVWRKVEPEIKSGDVLCYDCFCEVCKNIGQPTVWMLKSPNERG